MACEQLHSSYAFSAHQTEKQCHLVQLYTEKTKCSRKRKRIADDTSAGFFGHQMEDDHGTFQSDIATDSSVTYSVIAECSGGGLTGHEAEYQHDLVQSDVATNSSMTSDITTDSTVTNSVITECSGGGLTGREAE